MWKEIQEPKRLKIFPGPGIKLQVKSSLPRHVQLTTKNHHLWGRIWPNFKVHRLMKLQSYCRWDGVLFYTYRCLILRIIIKFKELDKNRGNWYTHSTFVLGSRPQDNQNNWPKILGVEAMWIPLDLPLPIWLSSSEWSIQTRVQLRG